MQPETMPLTMAHNALVQAQLEKLLAAHGAGLHRVARTYAKTPAEAADLAQEIAVAVWRALPGFRGQCSERTFVFRIAHNRGISYAEASRVRERTTPLVEAPSSAADPRPTADDALDAARRRHALWRAIGALPVGSRSVITLALEGMSHEEIAEVLGSTANSVGVRLSKARAELRAQMKADEDGERR